jgi:hypothetical protein
LARSPGGKSNREKARRNYRETRYWSKRRKVVAAAAALIVYFDGGCLMDLQLIFPILFMVCIALLAISLSV